MTGLLIKLFIKDYQNTENPEVRNSYGKLSGIVGIICNALLFAGKIFAGVVSGSVSIIADAVNNLSDASSSVISLVGFKLSGRPADAEHPYGHGRYEYIAGLTVAMMIVVIGIELLREGVGKIIKPETVDFSVLTVIILVASVLVKLWMMLFNRKTGNRINSKTLLAAAADSRNDVISTVAVLIGVFAFRFWGVNLDGWIGAAVALFIIISGFGMVKDTLDPILGKAPDSARVEEIRKKIMQYDGVLGTHDLMVHDYGALRQFASVHVEMSAEGDALANHDVIDTIERDFLKNEGLHLIVHFDPVPSKNSALGDLREWISDEVKKLDKRITIHDLKIAESNKNITLDCVVPRDIEIGEKEIKQFLSNITAVKYPDYSCEVTIDRSYAEIVN